jgi:hypothetical protein
MKRRAYLNPIIVRYRLVNRRVARLFEECKIIRRVQKKPGE